MPLLETIAPTIIGGAMGLMLQQHNDKRQLEQQRKLQMLQMQGQKEMTEFNYDKQMQMWRDTNYSAQIEQLQKAGLNPGLLYGMGGAGGQSTNIQQGNVTGANAPTGGREVQDMAGMGIQMALLDAQRRNIDADTKVKEATIPKLGAEVGNIAQGTINAKAQEEILEIEKGIKDLQLQFDKGTLEDRMDMIDTAAAQAIKQLDIVGLQYQLDVTTVLQKAEIIKQEAIGAALKNLLTQAQTKQAKANTAATYKGIQATDAQIQKWSAEILQGWKTLDNKDKEIRLQAVSQQMEVERGYDWRGVRYHYSEKQLKALIDKIVNNE